MSSVFFNHKYNTYLLELLLTDIPIPPRPSPNVHSGYVASPGSGKPPTPTPKPNTPTTGVAGPNTLAGLTDVNITNAPKGGYVLTYNDTSGQWTPQPVPIIRTVYISISITGPMNPSEVLMQYAIPEAVAIPAGGAYGSFAISSIAASGYVTATINKNSQQVGTIVWGPNGYLGTINIPSKLHLVAGDVLQIVAPAKTDSTLANIGITFACVRGG